MALTAAAYARRRVLVTGATGVIGRELVALLIGAGARVRAASLHEPVDPHPGAEYVQGDLMSRDACAGIARGVQDVFHLAAVRGSVAVGRTHAADFHRFIRRTAGLYSRLHASRPGQKINCTSNTFRRDPDSQ